METAKEPFTRPAKTPASSTPPLPELRKHQTIITADGKLIEVTGMIYLPDQRRWYYQIVINN